MKGPTAKRSKSTAVDPASGRATAEYLAAFLPDLVRLADGAGLELVAYLLEMARVEAESEAQVAQAQQ